MPTSTSQVSGRWLLFFSSLLLHTVMFTSCPCDLGLVDANLQWYWGSRTPRGVSASSIRTHVHFYYCVDSLYLEYLILIPPHRAIEI